MVIARLLFEQDLPFGIGFGGIAFLCVGRDKV